VFDELMKKHDDPTMTMKKEINTIYSNYSTKGEYRTVHFCPNNPMMLSKMHFCWINKDIQIDIPKLKLIHRDMIEEELRRFVTLPSASFNEYVSKLLNLETNSIVKQYIEVMNSKSMENQSKQAMLKDQFAKKLIASKLLDPKDAIEFILPESKSITGKIVNANDYFDKNFNLTKPCEYYMEQLEQYKKAMKSDRINAINTMMKEFGVEEISSLLDLGIKTPQSFALLCIQNVMHSKNVDRYHSFTKGTYVCPFEEGKCTEELEQVYSRMIANEMAKH
jgi:hypothetical protein